MVDIGDKRFFFLTHLLSYPPADTDEAESLERMIRLVRSDPNCFENANMPGHITGSALLVDTTLKYTLLTHHKKIGKWLQFGGHSDGDSNPFNVAIRETVEESGIGHLRFHYTAPGIFDIDIHKIPAHNGVPEHEHYDVRILLITERDSSFTISDESNDLRWVSLDAVAEYNSQRAFLRMANKAVILRSR